MSVSHLISLVADLRRLANRAPVGEPGEPYVAIRAAADRIEHLERVLAYEAMVIEAQTDGVMAIRAKRRSEIEAITARMRDPLTWEGKIADYSDLAALYATVRSSACTDRGKPFYGPLLRLLGDTAAMFPVSSPERNALNEAFERIIELETVIAVEAFMIRNAVDLKAISGSRREILDRMIDRMYEVASGGIGDYSHTYRLGSALDRLRRQE